MSIIFTDGSGPIKWPKTDSHDPQSKKYYFLIYRPNAWEAATEYIKDVSLVIPTVANGCMYVCVSGGISGVTQPVWDTTEGKTIIDGTVKWKCMADNSKLRSGDTITSSTWTTDTGVTLNPATLSSILNGRITAVRVDGVDSSLTSFSITNKITITRISYLPVVTEEFERTLIIPVKQL